MLGGDRLPWVCFSDGDNFDPLRSLDWQLHIYGQLSGGLSAEVERLRLRRHIFPWTETAAHAGLLRDAAYLVRPDGYVALALPRQETGSLPEYAARNGLQFGA